jgi:hypothetical protein
MKDEDIILREGEFSITELGQKPVSFVAPSVQSCVAVCFFNDKGMGMVHLDTPFHVRDTIENMLSRLKKYSNQPIKAEIAGGDKNWLVDDLVFVDFASSASIYKELYQLLDEKKVSYSHQHYNYIYGRFITQAICALAVAAWMMNKTSAVAGCGILIAGLVLGCVLDLSNSRSADIYFRDSLNEKPGITVMPNRMDNNQEAIFLAWTMQKQQEKSTGGIPALELWMNRFNENPKCPMNLDVLRYQERSAKPLKRS